MVQILKPQMRNYQADQTEAIAMSQTAQNIGEWADTIQGVANIVGAFQKGADRRTKEAEQADQDIINTEIGEQANIQASVAAGKALGSLDPTSEAGITAINEAYAKAYAPYAEQMGSERGKIALQTKQRQGADAYIKSASKAYSSEKAVKARQAAANLQNAMSFKAEELGAVGDLESFQELSSKNLETIGKYVESQGGDKQQAMLQTKAQYGNDFIIGKINANPLEAASIIGVDDIARDQMIKAISQQNPNLSKREAGAIVDDAYKRKTDWSNKQLEEIYGADTIDYIRENKISQLEKERSGYAKGSPAYRHAQEEIEKLEGDGIYESLREELREQFAPQINRSVQEHILAEDKRRYNEVVGLMGDVLDADPVVSSTARQTLKQLLKTKEGKEQFARIVDGEISAQELYEKIDTLANNIEDVKMQKHPTYKGTVGIEKTITEFADDKTSTPAQLALKAASLLNDAHKTEITDGQEKELQSIIYKTMSDRAGADLWAKTFNNADRYFPDLNWAQRYLPSRGLNQELEMLSVGDFKSKYPEDVDNAGQLRQNRSSKAQAENVVEAQLTRIMQTAVTMGEEALMLEGDARVQAMKKIEDYIIAEKRNVFDNVMADYGIYLPPLREKLKLGQPVYLQIGSKTKQYLGDNPDGTPKFVDYVDPSREQYKMMAMDRLSGISELLKNKKGE